MGTRRTRSVSDSGDEYPVPVVACRLELGFFFVCVCVCVFLVTVPGGRKADGAVCVRPAVQGSVVDVSGCAGRPGPQLIQLVGCEMKYTIIRF